MKKQTINTLTTVLGSIAICAGICTPFLIDQNVGLAMFGLFVGGSALIYFKNTDMQALIKNYLKKFTTNG